MKLAICTPTMTRPYQQYLDALEASVPALDAAGIEHNTVFEVGCPYISGARCTMLNKALKWGADTIVFIDHDLSWRPEDLVKLVTTEGDAVAGFYRFKTDEVKYMGVLDTDEEGYPKVRKDGCLKANRVPGGFVKVTRRGVERFLERYPELAVGHEGNVDLFNHGAIERVWHGEDYAFSRRWLEIDTLWVVPDLSLHHHGAKEYAGNYHEFLLERGRNGDTDDIHGA